MNGNVSMMLMTVMMTASVRPATYPAPSPSRTPRLAEMSTAATPTTQRDPAPVDDPREQVAAHLVGAEDVLARAAGHPGGRRQAVADVDREGVLGRDPRGEDGGGDDEQQEHRSPPGPT